jgi:hypothetical protein
LGSGGKARDMRYLWVRRKGEGHEIPKGQEEWQGTGRRARDMGHLWGKRKGEGHETLKGQEEG